jgi:hypothetical protein
MSETPDTRIVTADCVGWSTKGNGKPDGGGDSKPVAVAEGTVVVVYGVSVDVEPKSLLVQITSGSAPAEPGRKLEIRERFLAKQAG